MFNKAEQEHKEFLVIQSLHVTGWLRIQRYIESNPALFAHLTIWEKRKKPDLFLDIDLSNWF